MLFLHRRHRGREYVSSAETFLLLSPSQVFRENPDTMEPEEKVYSNDSPVFKFFDFCKNIFVKPAVWFRESVVEPNRQESYWYHEKLRRVPTVDECLVDDMVCVYEANQQFLLDMSVDKNIVEILRKRFERCTLEYVNEQEKCDEIKDYWQNAITNFYIKYGELGFPGTAVDCLMKQKHRLAWERRHGPVGTGKKPKEEAPSVQEEAY